MEEGNADQEQQKQDEPMALPGLDVVRLATPRVHSFILACRRWRVKVVVGRQRARGAVGRWRRVPSLLAASLCCLKQFGFDFLNGQNRLGLLPLRPDHFGNIDQIGYPVENAVEVMDRGDDE